MINTTNRILSVITVLLVVTISSFADVLVYDGVPTSGDGAYTGGDERLRNQNPTHASIIGEINAWQNYSTGTIIVSDDDLSYPDGIALTSQVGSVKMTNSSGTDSSFLRSLKRAISTPLSDHSFYFSVLLSYDDLDSYPDGHYAVWGLTKTVSDGAAYPASDGILVGFQRTSTGVDAVIRVLSQSYVIQSDIVPGTYHFAGHFDFNYAEDDIISASLNPGATEPTTWDVTATNNVLSLGDELSYINVGFNYGINNHTVYVDEWRIGNTYADIVGSGNEPPTVFNTIATNITSSSAWMNGYVSSTGTASTVVSIYHGGSDEGSDTEAWEDVYTFPSAANSEPQNFTFQATGLTQDVRHYYRFAASNAFGFIWAPTVVDFLPQSPALPVITNIMVGTVNQTTAELTVDVTATLPETSVYVCWDTSDKGIVSTNSWSNVKYIGAYLQPVDIGDTISGLTANGTYYARFYAVNSIGDTWTQTAIFTNSSPTVSITDEYINEGDTGTSPINLKISLDMPSAIDTVIYYQTSDDTAIANVNYIPADTSLTIPAGITSTNVTIQAIGNTKDEFPGVGFWVTLTSADNLTIGTSTAEAGILDDDMGNVLFSDDFSDGNDDGWTRITGGTRWNVSSQLYNYSGTTTKGETISGESQWKDYGVRVMMRTNDGWQRLGLIAYSQGELQSAAKYTFSTARTLGTQSWSPSLKAGDITLDSISQYAGGRVGTDILRPIAMRINNTPEGVRIRCYIGFKEMFDYLDTGNTYTSGMIGLSNGGNWMHAYYDDVKVFSGAPRGTILILQ